MLPFNKCLHKICRHCSDKYTEMKKYGPGSIVQQSNHRCSICNICDIRDTPALEPHFREYIDHKTGCLSIPSGVRIKYCNVCVVPFKCHLSCGGDERTLKDICESCEKVEDAVICPNPNCKLPISRTEGCDHMECICGWHFCYKCRFVITGEVLDHIDTIHWICDEECSQATCDKYVEEYNYYP